MSHCNTKSQKSHFSPRAALAALGVKIRQLQFFKPVNEHVDIHQKTVKHTPLQKLYDAFIAILAGSHGMVEINKRLRNDPGLQAAFGRTDCAEQSVVQRTLDACTTENVEEIQAAVDEIYHQHSAGYRHAYEKTYQLLDVDMSGLPCGRKAAFATKGYFAKQRNRRGRQLGRVLATHYDEIVVDRLFAGNQQLTHAFQPLIEAAEQTLDLDEAQRARTILRVDSGGGSLDDLNWALERGYQLHGKDYSGKRARKLAETVTEWVDDPKHPGRQVGWVTAEPTEYARPVRRIAVRCRKKNQQWGIGVLITTLSDKDILALTQQPCHRAQDPHTVLLAMVYFYDQRSGGVETSFKEDHQGLGIHKRNKKRFAAQQVLGQLNVLAHNVIVWARAWLAPHFPQLARLGIQRIVRDIFPISGFLGFDAVGHVSRLTLNRADPFSKGLIPALRTLLRSEHVAVNLGEI
jgi:hypothetical protein